MQILVLRSRIPKTCHMFELLRSQVMVKKSKGITCWKVVDFFFFFFNSNLLFIYLFLYLFFWLRWVSVSAWGLSLVAASGGHSSSRCAGLFTIAASLAAEHRLQTRRLSSRGPRAQPLRGTWDPPRPGPEPASPALAGRLSTTAPPGKPMLTLVRPWWWHIW